MLASLLVPAALVVLAAVGGDLLLVLPLAAYLLLFTVSADARRLGRSGWQPCTPRVLGGGWSWVLRGTEGRPTRVIARGRVQGDWWHAGTPIGQVQRALAADGRTLPAHPSILSATLGGWVASGSHGSGGALWTPALGRLLVEGDAGLRLLASKRARRPDDVVLQVEVRPVADVPCDRSAFDVDDLAAARRFLADGTHLRAVFVDWRQALAFVWSRADTAALLPLPLRYALVPPPGVATLLPARVRRWLPRDAWRARISLREANAFAPEPPFVLGVGLMALHTNFEVFVRGTPTTPALVLRVCAAFRRLFASGRVRGRMELRCGPHLQMLDLDLMAWCAPRPVFETIAEVYGPAARVRLHRGKARVDPAPLAEEG